jgi:hypothetical protein
MRESLDRWYRGNGSVKVLEQDNWNHSLVEGARALAIETRARLGRLLGTTLGGAEPTAATMNDLHAIGFNLREVSQAALPALDEREPAEPYMMKLGADDVPAKKSLADWLLFRSGATVRRRLFGEDMTQEIAPEVKAIRMPQTTCDVLLKKIDAVTHEKFSALPGKYSDALLTGYVGKFRTELLSRLNQHREQLLKERADRRVPCESNTRTLAALDALNVQAKNVAADIYELAQLENALPLTGDKDEAPAPPAADLIGAPAITSLAAAS